MLYNYLFGRLSIYHLAWAIVCYSVVGSREPHRSNETIVPTLSLFYNLPMGTGRYQTLQK